MVSSINQKLLRDLLNLKAQIFTISLVVASGVATFISSWSTYDSLVLTKNSFYSESHFSEVFSEFKNAPPEAFKRLQQVLGLSLVESRLVTEALLNMPDLAEPAVGRFISLPDHRAQLMNKLHLTKGRLPEPDHPTDVVASFGFAKAHNLNLGSQIPVVFNGRYRTLTIVGIGLSPEYVFAIRETTPLPDDLHFGIFWISESALGNLTGKAGTFNSITAKLQPGTNEKEALREVDEILRPYGNLGSYLRKNQTSDLFLSDEIKQMKTQAYVMPSIFLAVAAFLLNVILSRLIATQRTQIATLRACGYTKRDLFFHYLKMVLLIVSIGCLGGILAGFYYGRWMTSLYVDFYRFPSLEFVMRSQVVLWACTAAVLSGIVGTVQSLATVFRLQPAEAMRPPAPPIFHGTFSNWITELKVLGDVGRMLIRNIFFRPFRLALALIGIGLAIAIIVLGLFWTDSVKYIFKFQFEIAQREDAQVVFGHPLRDSVLHELQQMDGVLLAEGVRVLPARIHFENRSYQLGLTGIMPNSQMRILLNKKEEAVPIPPDGLLLTTQIATKLGTQVGDKVWVEVLEGRRQKLLLTVSGLVDDWVGYGAYMDLGALWTALGEDRLISFANIRMDKRKADEIFSKLKNSPGVAAVNSKEWSLKMFRDTTARFVLVFGGILTFFALLITVGIVYNSSRILLSERSWEYASLRILGFRKIEVFSLLFSEIMWQILLAIPFGVALGYWLGRLSTKLIHTDTFQFPFILQSATVMTATLLVAITGVISALVVGRKVQELDIVAALKERD